MKRMLKSFWHSILFIFSHSGPIAKDAVDNSVSNYGGQGKDKYGR